MTKANQRAVLAEACGKSTREIKKIAARLAPKPDVPASIRKLPAPRPAAEASRTSAEEPASASSPAGPAAPAPSGPVPAPPESHRPLVEPLTPERYRLQLTMDEEMHDDLRCLQDLMRREIPDGDPGAAAVRRTVWKRDGGQCAFISRTGVLCTERSFLEFHHEAPYALGGGKTAENISLRCRAHSVYESELIFGPYGASTVREASAIYAGFVSKQASLGNLARTARQPEAGAYTPRAEGP